MTRDRTAGERELLASFLDQQRDAVSLRWSILHVIEETARHAGHADVIREHLDGTTGHLPADVPY